MLTFPSRARTGSDGTLYLEVSTGILNSEVDVLIVVEAVHPGGAPSSPAGEWPVGYFELFGSLRDVDLKRPPQGQLQDRLPLE